MGTRESVEKKRRDSACERQARLHDFAPALGAVKHHRSLQLRRNLKLRGENVAHALRYIALAQAVEADLADTGGRIRRQSCAQNRLVERIRVPRVRAEEQPQPSARTGGGRRFGERLAKKVARRIADEMAVGVCQRSFVSSQAFTSIRGMWNGPLKMLPFAGCATVPSRCR